MAREAKRRRNRSKPRLGKLPPLYKLFLNPYTDQRFTSSCPGCSGKTRQRKLPLAIHVDDWGMVILNKTCRFCPYCELLIAHRDQIEAHLVQLFARIAPDAVGSDYLIVGTVERKQWRRGMSSPLTNLEMLEALHDFKDHLRFEPAPRWVYTGPPDETARPR